jgi:hypothetical protein
MPIGQTVYCRCRTNLNLLNLSRVSTQVPKGSE